jgi:DNA-directed RNA polymerase subunit RPC12/RpoP
MELICIECGKVLGRIDQAVKDAAIVIQCPGCGHLFGRPVGDNKELNRIVNWKQFLNRGGF